MLNFLPPHEQINRVNVMSLMMMMIDDDDDNDDDDDDDW